MGDALSEREAALLAGWIESPPGSAFVVEALDPAQGQLTLRDLILPGRTVTVDDAAAAKHGEVGQILLARPLPERDRVRLSGATVVLPAAELEGLLGHVAEMRERYTKEHEGAPEADFLRAQAHGLTHYALAWADRAGRPAVALQDPEREGAEPARRVVRRVARRR